MLQQLNRNTVTVPEASSTNILQFGGGNFLRAFADWIFDVYNEKTGEKLGIVVVKPTQRGDYAAWRAQDGLFHVLTKGIQNGKLVDEKRLICCLRQIIHPYKEWDAFLASAENPELRYIISNTTENGIRFNPQDTLNDSPPHEFPAKLTAWLWHRYQHFNASDASACVFLPSELIEENASALRDCILQYAQAWNLGEGFEHWMKTAHVFCNTLVDRIVPGVAKNALAETQESLGFQDEMLTQCEPYHLWVIEAPQAVREALPLDKIGLNIIYTDDLSPYRTSKVRILNGAHTSMVPVGYLSGLESVRAAVEDEVVGKFVRRAIFEEIIPSLDIPEMQLEQFAEAILDRFRNPFIHHQLISISLNSISKFRTRVLPSILAYQAQKASLPNCLLFSMAALIHFYKGEMKGSPIPLKDDAKAIAFLQECWQQNDGSAAAFATMAKRILQWQYAWQQDLTKVEGFADKLADYLFQIERIGMEAIRDLLLRIM